MYRALASALMALTLCARAEWTGKHPQAWTNQYAVDTATVWAASVTLYVTNWTATNAYTVATNTFLDPILGGPEWADNPWTSSYVVTWTAITTGGVRYATNSTRIVTNALSQTSVVVRAREIISLDVWRATRERAQALGTNWPVHYVYRRALSEGHRQNLVNCKAWLNTYWPQFVDRVNAQSFTNWGSTAYRTPPPYTNRNVLLTRSGVPTNWLDYTPWRQLDGYGIAFTNTNTVAGTSDLDYGYKHALSLFTNAVWTASRYNYDDDARMSSVASDESGTWQFTASPTWAGAQCGSTAAWTSQLAVVTNPCDGTMAYQWFKDTGVWDLPRRYAVGSWGYGTDERFIAEAYNTWLAFSHGVGTTNRAHAADLWLARATNIAGVYTLDQYGYTFATSLTFTGTYYSVTSTAAYAIGPTIGETDEGIVPTWPDAPATNATPTVRGYILTNAAWLIRWDIPNGFDYK